MPSGMKFMGRNSLKDDWLGAAIETYYAEEVKASWRKPKKLISPSMCWSECPREIQIRLLGYQPRFSPQTRRRMDNGTDVHRRWENVFRDMGIVVMEEDYLGGVDIGGTPDAVVARVGLSKSPENLFLMELKSINTNGWRKLPWVTSKDGIYRGATFAPGNLAALAKAQPRHVTQWLAYDRLLLDKGHDIGRGFIFYECKDDQRYGYLYVVRDDPLFEKLAENAFTALKWNRQGTLLGMPFEKTSLICKGCDCQGVCFREANGDEAMHEKLIDRLKEVAQPAKLKRRNGDK